MPNELRFTLNGREYDLSAPTALQLRTLSRIIDAEDRETNYGKPPKNIIDVGACIGSMALLFTTLWPDAEIVAIEPHPVSYGYLERNCRGFDNIRPVQVALSDKRETIRLALPKPGQRNDWSERSGFANIGMVSRYGASDTYVAEVEAVPLDSLMCGPVDFIKIDVEGAEETVLLGAQNTLDSYRPRLAIEIRPGNLLMAGSSYHRLLGVLARLGYVHMGRIFGDVMFIHRDDLP